MGTGGRAHVDLERVAARDPAGRMHHDGVAHALAFGVERLLHDEGAFMPARGEDGSRVAAFEAEREARSP